MTQEILTPITTSADLAAFCQRLGNEEFITVDTEFMRERTYYPQLCLVQIAGETESTTIDALAEGLDWTPFWELLKNPKILKIFHSPRQDIEIFVNMAGVVPQPLFDTQIAAMAVGFPEQVSYAGLADALTGTESNKEEQYTDWTARPLRPAQLTYALQDVTVLRHVYKALLEKLQSMDRLNWVTEEMAVLNDINHYRVDPEHTWERLRLRSNKPASWAALRGLAAWREREAMRVNRPRQMVLKDDVLSQLALSLPTTQEILSKTRGLPNHLAQHKHAENILAIMTQAKSAGKEALPQRADNASLTSAQEDQLELLKLGLKITARLKGIAPKMIANNDDLEQFVLKSDLACRLRQGWRWDLYGEMADKLLTAEAAISAKGIILLDQ